MTTIKLTGGDLGSDKMIVRCNLADAASPVEVDYCDGSGWQSTQYQAANALHRKSGLIAIGKDLAAVAIGVPGDEFECEWSEGSDIAIYCNDVWAGNGRLVDGSIVDCPAVLGDDQDESDDVYDAIEQAISDGLDKVTSGGDEYTWSIE